MIATLVLLAAMLVLHLLTPFWWWIMLLPFAYGTAAARSGGEAFRTGSLSAGLLWLGAAVLFLLTGADLIAARMASLLGLGASWLMVPATALPAAVAAGVSAAAGFAIRRAFGRKPG